MFRRLFWLSVGAGAGATGAVLASRWLRRQVERLAPPSLAREAGRAAVAAGEELASLIGEFRAGMAEREADLRRELGEDA